jgi:hypothetical protein
MALTIVRWVQPAILDETVTKDTVNPTDCELVNQKHANLDYFCDAGRYAMHAAETVHKILAAVATSNPELGTFNVIIPLMSRATIRTPSPTDWN